MHNNTCLPSCHYVEPVNGSAMAADDGPDRVDVPEGANTLCNIAYLYTHKCVYLKTKSISFGSVFKMAIVSSIRLVTLCKTALASSLVSCDRPVNPPKCLLCISKDLPVSMSANRL